VPGEPIASKSIAIALAAFGVTLLVAGTLFLRFPQGLGALADTIPSYLESWVIPSGIPVLRLPASLLVYEALALVFAIIAVVRTLFTKWFNERLRQVMLGLCIWSAVALLLPLLYAGRQVGDMAWLLVPLWALAASEISRALIPEVDKATWLLLV
jgi:hypothetical protein